MNYHHLLFGAFICWLSMETQASPMEEERIKNGLKAGDKLLDAVDNLEFEEIVPQLGELTLSFMEALTEMIQIIQNKNSEEDLDKINQMLYKYNQRLRNISAEFSDVKLLINWNAAKINYGALERSIMALKLNMQNALNAPSEIMDNQKQYYITMFENDYHNAATKLYSSLTSQNMIFSENLIYLARKYTHNHRKLIHHFLLGVYKLIMEGLELEATYLIFKGYTSSISYIKRNWEGRFNEMKHIYNKEDLDIANNWFKQASQDVDYYANVYIELTNSEYANKLYKLYSDKFYWRNWIVLAYEPVFSFSQHAMIQCENTILRYRQNGRNVAIESVPKVKTFDAKKAQKAIDSLPISLNILQKNIPLHLLNHLMNSVGFDTDEACYSKDYAFLYVSTSNMDFNIGGDSSHYIHQIHTSKKWFSKFRFNVVLFG